MLRPVGLCAALVIALATPAHAAEGADLTITAEVAPGVYVPEQEVSFKVTITNKGNADATGVKARGSSVSGSSMYVQSYEWGDLGEFGPGGVVKAGATRVLTVTSTFWDNQGDSKVEMSLRSDRDANPADDKTTVDVDVIDPGVRGSISGFLYGDDNNNGRRDMFEWPIEGAEIGVYTGGRTVRATTDQNGRFTLADLPARQYRLEMDRIPGGWIASLDTAVRVDGGPQSNGVVIGAVRPLTDFLSARIDFEQNTYAVGAEARMRVTLTSKANRQISGIKASCDRAGNGHHVDGTNDPARWGDLAYSRPGVTLQPFETRVFNVTGVVLPASAANATVYVACDFGQDEQWLRGHPGGMDAAKVPGAPDGPVRGQFYQDRNTNNTVDDGELVPGLQVEIADWTDGRVVATPTTDQNGRIAVEGVPSGPYRMRILSPGWKNAHGDEVGFRIFGGCERCWPDWLEQVVPA